VKIRLEPNFLRKSLVCFEVTNCSGEEYSSLLDAVEYYDTFNIVANKNGGADFYLILTKEQALIFKLSNMIVDK